jgi:hypothetical protein
MRAGSGVRPSRFALNLAIVMAWLWRQISGQNVKNFPTYAPSGGGAHDLIRR